MACMSVAQRGNIVAPASRELVAGAGPLALTVGLVGPGLSEASIRFPFPRNEISHIPFIIHSSAFGKRVRPGSTQGAGRAGGGAGCGVRVGESPVGRNQGVVRRAGGAPPGHGQGAAEPWAEPRTAPTLLPSCALLFRPGLPGRRAAGMNSQTVGGGRDCRGRRGGPTGRD